jgi:hypothetical protein
MHGCTSIESSVVFEGACSMNYQRHLHAQLKQLCINSVVIVVFVYPNLICKWCYFDCRYKFSDNCFEVNSRVDQVYIC